MKPGSIGGAIIGGVIGALVWGAIAKFMHVELGYVAWGVGLAVGFLSQLMGGRGVTNGIACAVVALAAIFGGRVLAIKWSATTEAVAEMMKDNPDYLKLSADERKDFEKYAVSSIGWPDAVEAAASEPDAFGIIFGLLGIVTAFKVGGSGHDEEPKPGPMGQSPLRDVAPPAPAGTGSPDVAPHPAPEPPPNSPSA